MRLTTIDVDVFQHDGLKANRGWSEFDYGKADAPARQALRDHVGRFVKIHPDDEGELITHGLTLEGGRLVKLKVDAPAPPVDPPPVDPKAKADPPTPQDTNAPNKSKGK